MGKVRGEPMRSLSGIDHVLPLEHVLAKIARSQRAHRTESPREGRLRRVRVGRRRRHAMFGIARPPADRDLIASPSRA